MSREIVLIKYYHLSYYLKFDMCENQRVNFPAIK